MRREKGKRKNRFKVQDPLADERCTRSIMDFLRTTEVGRRLGPRGAAQELDGDRRSEGGDSGPGPGRGSSRKVKAR